MLDARSYALVLEQLQRAADTLFQDPRVRAVGITVCGDRYGFRVVTDPKVVVPFSSSLRAAQTFFNDIPISYKQTSNEIRSLARKRSLAGGTGTSALPEQQKHRQIACGLEIQNIDHDSRAGNLAQNDPTCGTLGCFVRLANGVESLLSCNHVIAGENSGLSGDRIVQPSSSYLSTTDDIAKLHAFQPLRFSSRGAKPHLGNVQFNEIDAAVAVLDFPLNVVQTFLPQNKCPSLQGTAQAKDHETVFKVGRTTGYTVGEIVATNDILPADYESGPCWFRSAIQIEGPNGQVFAASGDSGAAIVNMSGKVLGILFAGDDSSLAWACPIDLVLSNLNCTLI